MVSYLLMVLLFLTGLFLVLLVLIQRGRGGGLAGAFGGMGGQSAFGTKAGDVFTRVTIVTAAIWILLCALSVKILGSSDQHVAIDESVPATQSDKDKAQTTAAGTAPGNTAPGNTAPGNTAPASTATDTKAGGGKDTAAGASGGAREKSPAVPKSTPEGKQ